MATEREWIKALSDVEVAHREWVGAGCGQDRGEKLHAALVAFCDFEDASRDEGHAPVSSGQMRQILTRTAVDGMHELKADNPLWNLVNGLLVAFVDLTRKSGQAPESVEELKRQGVPPKQICEIWGITKSDGTPDFTRLNQEVAKPGSVVGPDYKTPLHRQKDAARELAQSDLATIIGRRSSVLGRVPLAPESIETLALNGVSRQQIARMKNISEDEVQRACDAAGVQVLQRYDLTSRTPSTVTDVVQQAVAAIPDPNSDAPDSLVLEEDDMGEVEDEPQLTPEQIVESLAAEGLDAPEIAKKAGMTVKRVTGILKSLDVKA